MAKQSINQLRQWFETGDYPTQNQFWDWLDSFFHKDDAVTIDNIGGLTEILQGKAEQSSLQALAPVLLQTGTTEWVAAAGTIIEAIVFLTVGTKNIKAGTSVDGEEVIFLQEITTKAIFRPDYICDAQTTIYFGGVGSNTIIKILKR